MAEEEAKPKSDPEAKEKPQNNIGLAKQMMRMQIQMGALNLGIKGLMSPLKVIGSLPGLAKKLIGGFGSLVKSVTGLDISLKNVAKAFASGLQAADKLQERALGMGKTLGGFQTAFGGQLDKMPGILSQKLGTTMDMFDAGLRGNTLRVAQLAQIQKLAGRDSKALMGHFEGMQTSMGMTNDGLNSVAEATIKAQYEYGVNAEKLVGAMNALTQETKDMGMMEGLGEEFAGAVGEVAGMLGGRGEQDLAKIMKVLTGGAEMDMEASRLGIRDLRNRITENTSQKQLVSILLESVKTANVTTKSWQSNLAGLASGGLGRRTEVLTDQLGESVTAFTNINRLLETEAESKAKNMKAGTNILATLKQQALALWEPISNLWLTEGAKLYNQIVANATEIGAAFTAYIVNPIRDIVGGFMGSMTKNKNLMEGLKTVFRAVGKVITWVSNTLGKAFGGGGENIYDKVVNFFSDIILHIAEGIDDFVLGALPTIELAFLTVATTILRALNKVMDVDQSTIDSLEGRRQEAKYRMMSDEDVDALVTGINRGKNEFGSGYDLAGAGVGALGGAKMGAVIGTFIAPGIGTAIGAGIGGLAGAVGGWWAGSKAEDMVEGAIGDYWVKHPITGIEESFKDKGAAANRASQIQQEVRAEVAKRRETMSLADKVRLKQEEMLSKEEKSTAEQLDYMAFILDAAEETAKNTAPVEDALEVIPGTDFQTSMGEMLSSSILHVLKAATESANAEMLTVQQEIRDATNEGNSDRRAGNEGGPLKSAAGK